MSAHELVNEHKRLWDEVVKHAQEGCVEETLAAIAKWLEHDAETCGDELVKSLLDSAAYSCRSASFEFYASTK